MQIELFPADRYVDLSIGMTARSTKRKKRSPKPTNQTTHLKD